MELSTGISASDRLSYSKEMALLALMDRTSYNIVQENGQRRYGPPPNWHGPPPPKGCEVFVGKIPRDLYEDELVPVFERIGMIYEVRLMMDFSGSNRGYAFVMYTNAYDAKRAIEQLDNFEIRKNRFIGVCKSIDNCRLFVGGIPKNKTKEEVLREMRRVTDDVADVILYSSFQDKTKNRGFAFVEYETHKSAAKARRKLIPGKILLWGQEIAVDWAEPEPEVDENTMLKVTVLYVRNISPTTSEEHLHVIFSLKNTLQVEKVKKMRDFGFVHFAARADAETALYHLNGICVDGSVLEVTWAKPPDKCCRQKSRPVSISSSTASSYERGSTSLSNYDVTDIEALCNSLSHLTTAGVSHSSLRLRTPSPWSPPPVSYSRYNGLYSRPLAISSVNAAADSLTHKYRTSPNAIQVLDEYCLQNNLGDPCYYLQSFEGETSDCKPLYAYKVFIPGLSTYKPCFVPDRLTSVRDDAKLIAAEYILKELGLSTQNISSWHTASTVQDPLSTLSCGSHVTGTYPKVPTPSQVDLGQGDVGALFSEVQSVYAALQSAQVPFTKSYDVFDSTQLFELHGLNSN